jgi:meso-butanediol dehydrogenase/(S,S)-butanediol dehydrogenase/diacetyl reductase
MRMRLEGKVALVTDADSAGGSAIIRRFVKEGAQVAACPAGGGQPTGPSSEAGVIPGEVLRLDGDPCVTADAERIVQSVADRFGKLDVLVNHGAGGRIVGTILDISREEFEQAVNGDVWSVVSLSKAAIPVMAKNGGGSILNIMSIGRIGLKDRPLRAADAGALSTLTISMALDHGAQGVRVNGLALGPTQTSLPENPDELRALLGRFRGHAPLGTLHTAEDVAAAALFLSSDEARAITGAILPVDAGRSLPGF